MKTYKLDDFNTITGELVDGYHEFSEEKLSEKKSLAKITKYIHKKITLGVQDLTNDEIILRDKIYNEKQIQSLKKIRYDIIAKGKKTSMKEYLVVKCFYFTNVINVFASFLLGVFFLVKWFDRGKSDYVILAIQFLGIYSISSVFISLAVKVFLDARYRQINQGIELKDNYKVFKVFKVMYLIASIIAFVLSVIVMATSKGYNGALATLYFTSATFTLLVIHQLIKIIVDLRTKKNGEIIIGPSAESIITKVLLLLNVVVFVVSLFFLASN
jgi:hypothetical protein